MACPYAKYIKGTIAYCTLLNKKVSTLRYPCKGNYRRCPVYARRARRAPEAPRAAREQPPAPPPPKQAPEESKTQPAERAPQPEEAPKPSPPERPPAGPVRAPSAVMPSKSLCDSLVLASLIAASQAQATYRGPLRNLLVEASKHLGEGGLLFIVGRLASGVSVRILYAGRIATVAFERQFQPVCGEEALRMLSQLAGERVDAVIYRVNWDSIPLWKDQIAEELGVQP